MVKSCDWVVVYVLDQPRSGALDQDMKNLKDILFFRLGNQDGFAHNKSILEPLYGKCYYWLGGQQNVLNNLREDRKVLEDWSP